MAGEEGEGTGTAGEAEGGVATDPGGGGDGGGGSAPDIGPTLEDVLTEPRAEGDTDEAGSEPAGEGPEELEGETGEELEGDDLEGEAGEEEEPEGEGEEGEEPEGEEGEAVSVEVELPEELQVEGLESLELAVDDEEAAEQLSSTLTTLVDRYQDVRTLEEAHNRIQEYEQGLADELREFREQVESDPYSVIDRMFSSEEDPAVADRILFAHLRQDTERFARFGKMMDSARASREEMQRLEREAELDIRDRRVRQRELRDQNERVSSRATELNDRIDGALERVDEADREFVEQRLTEDVRRAIRDAKSEGKLLDPATVDQLAQPYLERFGTAEPPRNGNQPKDGAEGEGEEEVESAQQKLRARIRRRKRERKKTRSSSAPPPAGPEKGNQDKTLDEVLKDL